MQFVLSSLPTENPTFMAVATAALLMPEECERVIKTAKVEQWNEGQLASNSGVVDSPVGQTTRSVLQQRLPSDAIWALAKVLHQVSALNSRFHRFDLAGISQMDPAMLLKYEAQRTDHYEWHVDSGPSNSSRKLSFSLQLSAPEDYDGGELEFLPPVDCDGQGMRSRGALIVFPAFHLHRVTPLTRGTRHALVGWLHGNAFR